ncbi:MAG: ComEC/Rec2 family competence protein [Spirochaetaceae bacterium]|jgi:competence protein ComEC|nr:ComEC/Rec2 family competence protein [Spirochaetaceae bacterium]
MVIKHSLAPLSFAMGGAAGSYYGAGLLAGAKLPWAVPAILTGLLLSAALGALQSLKTINAALSGGFAGATPGERRIRRAELYLLFLAGGLALGFSARIAAGEPLRLGLPQGEISALSGTLKEDPRLSSGATDRGMGRLALNHAFAASGAKTTARGTLQVFFPGESLPRLRSFGRGAELYIEGKLLPPKEEGMPPVFSARAVHITRAAGPLERFRTGLRLSLVSLYGGKWGGLAQALLLGVRDNLDADLARAYRNAGLSHILALSGMHLGIIAAILAFLLKKPLGLKASAAFSSLCIILYVYLAAAQPSLARSAVMYLLGSFCVLRSLPRRLPFILGLSFIIQIILWPASGDTVSFMLSYLALAGILFLGEPLRLLLRGKVPDILALPLSASLGAFIFSMGITAFHFGLIQPVGILAGLVVSPLSTVFMAAAMAAPVLSLIPPLASIADGALGGLYRVIQYLVETAGAAPPLKAPWPFALAASLALTALVILLRERLIRPGERLAPFAAP